MINGGIINAYGTNARLGAGDWMVVEADESDGTFLKLPADVAIVTNIDPEHLDHFKTFDAVQEAFRAFIENVPFYGFAVMCTDHPVVQRWSAASGPPHHHLRRESAGRRAARSISTMPADSRASRSCSAIAPGAGAGAESRRPLGVAVVGGLGLLSADHAVCDAGLLHLLRHPGCEGQGVENTQTARRGRGAFNCSLMPAHLTSSHPHSLHPHNPLTTSPTLVRTMGRWSLAALMINSIVGSSVFGLPSIVAGKLGSSSPWAWVLAAIGTGFIVACVAEVASRFGGAGGPYLYARVAFGRLAGIESGWLLYPRSRHRGGH